VVEGGALGGIKFRMGGYMNLRRWSELCAMRNTEGATSLFGPRMYAENQTCEIAADLIATISTPHPHERLSRVPSTAARAVNPEGTYNLFFWFNHFSHTTYLDQGHASNGIIIII
jgi:hypothetical protein